MTADVLNLPWRLFGNTEEYWNTLHIPTLGAISTCRGQAGLADGKGGYAAGGRVMSSRDGMAIPPKRRRGFMPLEQVFPN